MTDDEFDQAIRELLDEETARHPDGAKTRDVEEAILEAVVELHALVEDDPRRAATTAIHRVAAATRRDRRRSLRTNVEYLLDGLTEDGAYVDPLFDLAYPVGTTDGEVKTLRFWTPEDFRTSVQMTYRKAADTTAAARLWDETAARAIAYIESHGGSTFGATP